MRVVSMVPSWTETLIDANVNVVGRTKYCIHPKNKVDKIPVVGGTKNWKFDKVVDLQPDLLILDKEENPKFMAEQKDIPWHASHIESIQDVPQDLTHMAKILSAPPLLTMSERWQNVLNRKSQTQQNFKTLPGLIEWGPKPTETIHDILYVIWKDPWMVVSRDTFIGSVLQHLGLPLPSFPEKYPKINLSDYNPKETLLLFSSEPYPFLEKKQALKNLDFPYAIVDGESFSWFGLRSLEFLEKQIR